MTDVVSKLSIADSPILGFHRRFIALALLSPFADGYIISVIGAGMAPITRDMGLGALWQGVIGAAALAGIFIGCIVGGWAVDQFGRRFLFRFDLTLLIVVSVAMLWVQDPVTLTLLRLLSGVATGVSYLVAALMLTEFIPQRYRGTSLSLVTIMWFGGAMTAYLVGDWAVRLGSEGWRIAFACAALPAIAAVIGRRKAVESPRWLVKQGRSAEAHQIVEGIYGPAYGISDMAVGSGEKAGLGQVVKSGYLKPLIFVSVFWGCSLVPLNIVYAFGPLMLQHMGFTDGAVGATAAIINVMLFIGCIIWAIFAGRGRRRRIAIGSFCVSGLTLLLMGAIPGLPAWCSMVLFAGFALSVCGTQLLQPIYPNEIFPTGIRGSAMGTASSVARIFGIVGIYLAPQILAAAGVGATLIFAAGVSFLGVVISALWAPETRGAAIH